MNSPDLTIYDRLSEILQDVFDNDAIIAKPELTAMDVEGWDSLGNVQVFLAIEQRFRVRFSAAEIGSVKNIGEMAAMIERKKPR